METIEPFESDKNILTKYDERLIREGLSPQHFHAFVLFADADSKFVKKLTDKLELEYNLRVSPF